MTDFRARRPHPDEYMPYFQRYIDRVPDGDVTVTMQRHVSTSLTILRAIPEAYADSRATIQQWIWGYNEERPHQALGYCSPRQYQQHRLLAA